MGTSRNNNGVHSRPQMNYIATHPIGDSTVVETTHNFYRITSSGISTHDSLENIQSCLDNRDTFQDKLELGTEAVATASNIAVAKDLPQGLVEQLATQIKGWKHEQ